MLSSQTRFSYCLTGPKLDDARLDADRLCPFVCVGHALFRQWQRRQIVVAEVQDQFAARLDKLADDLADEQVTRATEHQTEIVCMGSSS
jgi:hypothetical protein